MTKREYLEENYNAVVNNDIEPFQNIDNVEKGLYNYQYYNAMAKQRKALSTQRGLDYELKREYREQSDYYYSRKDKATLRVLNLMDYRGVTAYFVQVKSRFLKGKLYEIVLEDNEMILHSTSPLILKRLREEGVFQETSKKSIIDGYVNQRY